MNFSREIAIYNNQSDRLVASYGLKIPIDTLIEVLGIDKLEDPNVVRIYELNKEQYEIFRKFISNLEELCENCSAFYECSQT